MIVEKPKVENNSSEIERQELEGRYKEARETLFRGLSEFFSGATKNPPSEEDFRRMQQVLEELRLYSERKRKEEKP